VLWAPFGWAGLAGAVRWVVTVGLGLIKGAPGGLGGPGLMEAGVWAALGWAGLIGAGDLVLAGLGLLDAVCAPFSWAGFVGLAG